MKEAVVVSSSRTALAKSFRGSFNVTRPDEMAAHCLKDALGKVPALPHEEIEDVVMGCGYPEGTQGKNVGRCSVILAGLPTSIPGLTVQRACASGLQAISVAANLIRNEGALAAIGGGVESITFERQRDARNDVENEWNPWYTENAPGMRQNMGETAENVAKRYNISREAQDEYSLSSQLKTAAAQERGFFDEEITPMKVTHGIWDKATKGISGYEEVVCDKDECNRPSTTLEGLAGLKPVFDTTSGQGSVTAGNASQLSDGASVTVLMERKYAESLGIKPKLIFRGFAIAGVEPDEMGIGPAYAVPRLLKRQGLKVDDIDVWELNEAFASQVLYCRDRLGIDPQKLNPNGGAISIGHPFGMTGSRMTGTIANQLLETGGRYGVVTMCTALGMGAAGLFEACN